MMEDKTDSKPITILVVDDEQLIRAMIRSSLELSDYSVSEANNGLEALHAMTKTDFDMVLMDVRMPVMDGLEATTFLRKCEQGEHHLLDAHPELAQALHSRTNGSRIPVVACTAHIVDRDLLQQAGMDDCISKPFKLGKLYDMMDQFFGASKDPDEKM